MRADGFTLIELLVVMTIMGLLLAFTVPALRPLVAAQRVRAVVFDLAGDFVLARSEAVKRNTRVQVVPDAAGWAQGWTVSVDGSAQPLRRRDANGSGVTLAGAPGRIVFDEIGRVAMPGQPVRIDVLPDGELAAATRRCVALDPGGRPRTSQGACP